MALATAGVLSTSFAQAGGTINIGPDQSVSVGFGLRSSFSSIENAAPDGDGRSKDFSLDSVRLYMGASLNKYIKATFNTEKTGDNRVQVIDGIAQFEPMPEFNVWMGRMLPPTDRSNLDGPYYLLAWSYPGLVSRYPGYAVGRDNGLLAWGNIDKKVVYSVGAFEGHNNQAGMSSEKDNLLYAGRVAINLLDPELAPAYYTGSTYYGAADIFTIGLVAQHQTDGVGTAANKGDFNAYNIDVLYETKNTGSGSFTFEGAYYKYDTDDTVDVAGPADGIGNFGGIVQGKAYLASAAYLFPQQVGMGMFQPYVRYEKFETDLPGDSSEPERTDIGVNYIISGPNAKLSLTYFDEDDDNGSDSYNGVIFGVQLQF
ncbi:MAG TPA: porin [Spongiibacteraceae bacterium]|nr:porin [Spongiibacteraceae bacterium]